MLQVFSSRFGNTLLRKKIMTNRITLTTPSLKLIGADAQLLRADLDGPEALGRALGAAVADTWPPEHYDTPAVEWMLRATGQLPAHALWRSYYIVLALHPAMLVGTAGYKAAPDKDGMVEIGYSVVASFQRQGIASEAVSALLAQAYANGARAVAAETYPELVASLGVMRRCGMTYEGPGSEAGTVRYVHRPPNPEAKPLYRRAVPGKNAPKRP
jgi:[ribosomal protein S5]-alanine N-acetyltransferase